MSAHISAILGNGQWLDGGSMFGNAPRAVWEKWSPVDDRHRIELQCRCLLIEYSGIRILCEVGIGAFFDPVLANRYGVRDREHLLLKNLRDLGLSEDDIDYVVLSHLHFDHAGGLLPKYSESPQMVERLHFPKARYVVGRQAWERACQPHQRDQASFVPGLTDKLKSSGRLQIIEGSRFPGVLEDDMSFFYSDGHTPGQMHTMIRGSKHKVIFCGDLIPGVPWVHLPITMGYDRNAELVIDEKKLLYQKIQEQGWLMFFTHDPKVAMASLQTDVNGRYSVKQIWGDSDLQRLEI